MPVKVVSIIVTYNAMPWIDRCLTSLKESQKPSDVIVVDNQSTDGTVSHILENYSWVELIDVNENLGFGKANNMAMRNAWKRGYEYFFLLNQDAWLTKSDTLKRLVSTADSHQEYGIISPVHFERDEQKLDRHFGQYMKKSTPPFMGDMRDNSGVDKLYQVPFVNAAAWLIRKDCLHAVGLFHPLFDHYGEDINYIHRVFKAGFKVGVTGDAAIVHDRTYTNRKSAISDSEKKFKRRILIYLLNPLKNHNLFSNWIAVIDLFTRCMPRGFAAKMSFLSWCVKMYKNLDKDLQAFDKSQLRIDSN